MMLLFYIFAGIIIFHKGLLIYRLSHVDIRSKQIPSLIAAGLLVCLLVIAITGKSWVIFTLSYGLYILWTMGETIFFSMRNRKGSSPLLPIDLLLISGIILANMTEWWIIFVASYVVYWVLTFIVGRRIMNGL